MLDKNQKYMELLGLDKWYKAGITGKGVKIAVLDPGGKLFPWQEETVGRPLGDVGKQDYGHVASCCAAIAEFAPGAEIYALDTTSASWDWAYKNADIISCSYTGLTSKTTTELNKDYQKPVFIASGNDGNIKDGTDFGIPSSDYVIAVGAYNINTDNAMYYSNGGEKLECVIPSEYYVSNSELKPAQFPGTSASAPLIAAMFALISENLGRVPGLKEVREIIRNNYVDLDAPGKDKRTGVGLFIMPEMAENEEMRIEMTIGSNIAYVDGEKYYMDVEPLVINNRTMVPIRFISEALGCQVDYDNKTKGITIKKNNF